jgi:hypothetical protein
MNPTHADRLFETFPDLFDRTMLRDRIGCQDGWYELLVELGHSLHLYRSRTPGARYPVITSIVQEAGRLRVAALNTDPGSRSLIEDAENRSKTICELDGKPAAGCYGCPPAWVRPLCQTCADMHGCMRMDEYFANLDQPPTRDENSYGQEQCAL